MKVYARCTNCKGQISMSTNLSTRIEYTKQHGPMVETRCPHCNNMDDIHINKFRAQQNKTHLAIGLVLALALSGGGYLLFQYVLANNMWYISTFPSGIFVIYQMQTQKKISAFNRLRVKEK